MHLDYMDIIIEIIYKEKNACAYLFNVLRKYLVLYRD